ncbi:MAG: bifunctional DNA-formamidopyrimidine glycosylase/DNA-(apurinic or apyrimidinic site) lyase [Granulosicoccus sp.]|nr:bifunctional DNA-formamidopyrimidine glycosylase/DNA-(apurinic or apyrimidinic site) lyase [Granulosicoccus sp.]
MPELPEVETTRRGIEPYLLGRTIRLLAIHNASLRWPVPAAVQALQGAVVESVARRGKYLLIKVASGTAIVHLGMSGSLRICQLDEPRRKHDHIELHLDCGRVLRFHDPRRFGCFLWQASDEPTHSLLAKLGPEPLSDEFDGEYLFKACRRRQLAIKNLIMKSDVVVGVGNIYASESLFMAGIRPGRAAGRITRRDANLLADAIKRILQRSITQGGTTLRDFVNSDGNPGYFAQSLLVYGRRSEPCRVCGTAIKQKTQGQRSSFYCSTCQK